MTRRFTIAATGLAVLFLAAPTLLSLFAPSLIERSFARSFAGSLRIKSLRLGWWSETTIGPVEIFDDSDSKVGEISAELDATLWRMLSDRWWSDAPLVFGELKLSGSLDLERRQDGQANLERAFTPLRPSQVVRQAGQSTRPRHRPIEGLVRFDAMRVSIVDELAAAHSPLRSGATLSELSGSIAVDVVGRLWRADSDLTGTVEEGGEARALKIDGESVLEWGADGNLVSTKTDLDVAGFPILMIDGLIGMHGALAESIGSSADVTVRLAGKAGVGELTLAARAARAQLAVNLDLADGFVTATRGATLRLESISLLKAIPFVADLAARTPVEQWPTFSIEVHKLRLPVGDTFRTGAFDAAAVDWRGTELALAVATGRMSGRVGGARDGGEGAAQLVLEPARLEIVTEEITDGISIESETRVTIDGESGGSSKIDLSIRDLVDEAGALGDRWFVDGRVVQSNISSDLVQTVLDGGGAEIDAKRLLGAEIDSVVVLFKRDDETKDAIAATEIGITAHAANFDLSGRARSRGRVLESVGDGLVVDLRDASPLLDRLFASVQAPLLVASLPRGDGAAARMHCKDFRINWAKRKIADALESARLELALSNLSPRGDSDPELDELDTATRDVLRDAIGNRLSVTIGIADDRPESGQRGLPIVAAISGQRFSMEVDALAYRRGIRTKRSRTKVDIAANRASALLATLLGHPLRFLEPVQIQLEPDPIAIGDVETPGSAGRGAGDPFRVGLKSSLWKVDNIALIDPKRVLAVEPAGRVWFGRDDGRLGAELSGRLRELRGSSESDRGKLDVRVDYEPASGMMALDLVLGAVVAAFLDEAADGAGTASAALGANPAVKIRGRRSTENAPMQFTLNFESTLVEARDFEIEWDDRRIFLPKRERLVWRPDSRFLGKRLMGSDDALRNSPEITFDIEQAAFARTGGPFQPEVFALDVTVTTPLAVIEPAPGSTLTASGLALRLSSDKSLRGVNFDLHVDNVVGETGGRIEATNARGSLANLADTKGFLSPTDLSISAEGNFGRLPSSVVDTVAGLGGAVAAVAGPTLAIEFETSDLSRRGGSFELTAKGARGSANVKAEIRNDTLIITEPAEVTLFEIRPELVDHLLLRLPLISTFEKKREDGPGTITVEKFRYPLDGDMRKLNGVARMDFGRVRFQRDALLNQALNLTGVTGDTIAREFKPFSVIAENGVLTFEKYFLPIGSEEIATSGTIDLVEGTIDMVLRVPHLMLAETMAGNFRTGLSSLIPGNLLMLGSLSRLPIRVQGPLDDPKVSADLKLFIEESGGELRRAGGMLLKVPRAIFGD